MKQISLLVVGLIIGCASIKLNEKPADKIISTEKTVILREPGSIWSETSGWNNVFSGVLPRNSGDMIRVHYTDTFREQMTKRLKRDLPKAKWESAMDESDLAAQVSEVHAGGLYTISAAREIRFAEDRVRIKMSATVREKDILADDSVTWDQLFNLNWSIEADKA